MSPPARRGRTAEAAGVKGTKSARGGRGASSRRSSGLLSSRARFDARAARVRRRPWLLAAWLGGALALLAGGLWLVEISPVLVARSVSVDGVPARDASRIEALAAVPMGTPLVNIKTRVIAKRLIATTGLAEVTVSRVYPSTIHITARGRTPVLAVKDPQGQVHVVDSRGAAYAVVSAAPKGVPLINTVESPPSMESMQAAMAVLRTLSSAQRNQVGDVTVVGPNMVTFKLGAVTVVWGGASEPELKVKVMTALLRQPGIGTIDVSSPRTPAVR